MTFKETIFHTETQRVKIYKEDNSTLILETIEVSGGDSICLYMDKELISQLINQLSQELLLIK